MQKRWAIVMLVLAGIAGHAVAAGKLEVERAWIRTVPPGAMMLAGYATLHNTGDAPLIVTAADSADFGSVSLHQSVEENGVERMHPLGKLAIAPGASVDFTPGGKHFMLMQPKRDLKPGDSVKIHVATESGGGTTAEFVVRDTAP